jgi:hypothetical protein
VARPSWNPYMVEEMDGIKPAKSGNIVWLVGLEKTALESRSDSLTGGDAPVDDGFAWRKTSDCTRVLESNPRVLGTCWMIPT